MKKTDNRKCESCRYNTYVNVYYKEQRTAACDYIVKTGKRRPCPGGSKCTAYEKKKKGEVLPLPLELMPLKRRKTVTDENKKKEVEHKDES